MRQAWVPSDHRKSKVAWYADNGLEIDAPSELNNVRTKGFGKGRSDLKSRERNLGKIEEEERSKRIAADRARAVHEDANGPVLPSVLSVSLKNNYGAVACSAVSRDGVQVAAGYSDSNVVRVWRLDGGKHLGYTYGFSSSSSAGGVGAAGAPRRLRLLRLRRRLAPTISARRTVLSPRAHAVIESDAVLVGHSGCAGMCLFARKCAHAAGLSFCLSPSLTLSPSHPYFGS